MAKEKTKIDGAVSESPDPPTEGTTKVGATNRLILDLGFALMHQTYPVAEWSRRFRQYARRTPSEIVLPAVSFTGPAYDSAVQPPPKSLGSADPLKGWVAASREALGPDSFLWAKIIFDLQFLDTEHLTLRNQFGTPSGQCCPSNPIVQKVVRTFVQELAQHGVDGVVFDLSDCLPSAGAEGLNDGEVSATCFCKYCIDLLEQQGFRDPQGSFLGEHSHFRLALKPGRDGTSHLDPTQEMIDDRDVATLLAQSRSRGFVDESVLWEEKAKRHLEYCDARSRVVAESMRNYTQECNDLGLRSAAILSSVNYDQSQQTTLTALRREEAFGEYWVPDASESYAGSGDLVCYLGARSTYFVNSFFELVETANEYIANRGVEHFLQRLLHFSKQWSIGNRLSPASVFASELSDQYEGCVGIPLFEEEHQRLVALLTEGVTGEVLPEQIQEQFRIAAGPSALADEE